MGVKFFAQGAVLLLASLLLGCAGGEVVREGVTGRERLRAVQVEVEGDLSAQTVRALLPLRSGQPLAAEGLESALDSLTTRLRREPGTPYATLESWKLVQVAPERVDLHLTVNTGPVALVERIEFSGALEGMERSLRERIATRQGAPFSAEKWSADLARALDLLHEMGHPFGRVTSHPLEIVQHGDTVGVIAGVTLIPGRRVTLTRMELTGLNRTKPNLLQPLLALPEGNLYSPRELATVRRRLQATGLFTSVGEAELFRDPEGQFGTLFRVEEVPVGEASGAAGYAPAEEGGGLAGALDLRLVNLFGGGRSLAASWQRDSESLASYRLAYRQPWIFGTPLAVAGQLEQEVLDSSWVARQASLTLSYESVEGWALRGGVSARSVRADSFAVAVDTLDYDVIGLSGAVEVDTRDQPLAPRTGGTYRAWAELQFGRGEGPDRFHRSGLDLTQHLPLLRGIGLMAGVHAVDVRAEGGELPTAEWARIGGAATVRGFSERSLAAPRAGWANLELRRMMGDGSYAFLLTDAVVLDGLAERRWETSYGFGAQLGSGLGTAIRVAFAVPGGEGFSAGVVHLIARSTF